MPDPSPHPIQLRYFAWVREKVGRADEVRTPPTDIITVRDLMTWLIKQGTEYQTAFANMDVIRTAVDQRHVPNDADITGAKEIAFFPPVTGG